jgi:chromosome segregation ATPase
MFKPVDCAKYEKAVIDAQEVLDSDLLKLRDLYKDQAKYERQLTENRKQQKEIIDELVYQYSLIEGEQRDIANIQEEITSVQRRLTDPGITPQKKAQLQQQLKKLQEQLFESQEVVKVARATVEYLDGELQSLEEAERRINAALAGVNESITRMNAKIRTDESELAKAKRNLETCRKLQQQAIDLYLSCVSSFY